MINAIGQLLPLMVAVALSTVPILVTVTILLAPRSSSAALFFLIGSLAGSFAVTGVLTLILMQFPAASSRRNEPGVGVAEIVLGCALIAYGVLLLVRSRGSSPQTELPKWLRAVGTVRPSAALGLAVALTLRPKAILLSTAAALILGTSGLKVAETVIVLGIFVIVGGSSVAVPIILTLANPRMMRRPLESSRQWIVRNSRTVSLVVVFIVGTFVLGHGMTLL
jgi:hypothetical protein